MAVEDRLSPADEVIVAGGAFAGMQAKVLAGHASDKKGANLARHPGRAHFG